MIEWWETDDMSDAELHHVLKRHDPVVPPSKAELATLEDQIMTQIDALPDPSVPVDMQLSPWMLSTRWLLGGAATGLLFVMLGFSVGRAFDDLYSPPADSAEVFASADTMSWPSLIVAPSPTGDNGDSDDNAE